MKVARYIAVALFIVACGVSQAETSAETPHTGIPFKNSPTPLEDSGPRVGGAIGLLLIVVAGGWYWARRKFPHLSQLKAFQPHSKRLRVVEKLRLTPRTTVYLVELDSREILIGQSGDRIVRLDAMPHSPSIHNPDVNE